MSISNIPSQVPQTDINIAFIDDEMRVLRTLKMQFKRRYNVFTATDPDEFLNIIKQHHIHVAVSDQRMPKMSGVEVLSQVRAISPRTVRILLTGYADLSAIVASLNQGEIYRYLTKPWKTNELNDTMASAIEYAKTLASVDTVTAHHLPNASGRILLVDGSGDLQIQLEAQLANQYQISKFSTLAEATTVVKPTDQNTAYHIAVIDLDSEADCAPYLETLQTHYPELVVVALTSQQDSQQLIQLINERYVYRCIPKPVSAAMLQANISQAFSRHHTLVSEPKLIFR